ncbi:MAG: hypothetical protein KIT02_10430 [Devosia sp.]|uniref:phage regulatory CII family protein n=1 Tax=Devosia sp. TaxID=1871048 RepID=UPI0024C936D9|nr:phage regulatory CII family protein [Devosia sp.]UYN98382.1 MAG: hypothetical protein KIT02_10430 [Devosia sp.]
MTGRQLPANDYAAIKAATRKLISHAGGPVAAAAVTRGGHQNIGRYGSAQPDDGERFMPADVIADLESECGQPVLTRALAKLGGHLLVPEPDVVKSGTALGSITAKALKETSDVFVALAEGLGDGRLCAADAARIEAEVEEAIIKLLALRFQVRAEVEGGE